MTIQARVEQLEKRIALLESNCATICAWGGALQRICGRRIEKLRAPKITLPSGEVGPDGKVRFRAEERC